MFKIGYRSQIKKINKFIITQQHTNHNNLFLIELTNISIKIEFYFNFPGIKYVQHS